MNLPDAPIANEGFFATHFFVVRDQEKSKDFYVRILGGKVIKAENPCYIKLANTWIILNSGGGPTPDKPEVLLETPLHLNTVSSFLTLRVADIWACSISKTGSAMTALRLVELGKLSLDEDVNLKLKSWKLPSSEAMQGEKVTLRRLLSHTAGTTVHGFPGYAQGDPVPTLPQLLDGVKPANTAAIRVDIKPGTQWRYSGGGYEIVQQLIQDITGKSFAEVTQELVLGRLQMTHSTYQQPLPERPVGERCNCLQQRRRRNPREMARLSRTGGCRVMDHAVRPCQDDP
jgi:beta-lactamase family protein/glyoxalase/bleomycin resistance protein/dioxygenase superfamily protein